MVHAAIAETPITVPADLTAPVAVISPSLTSRAENTTLQPLRGIFNRERPPSISTTGGDLGRLVAVRSEHVWRRQGVVTLLRFPPFLPRRVPEAEPVLTALSVPVAVQADVPVPVGAGLAVIV